MAEFAYTLHLVEPYGKGFRDITQLVQSVSWAGDTRQIARELTVSLVAPKDGSIDQPNLAEGSALIFSVGGAKRFTGQILTATTNSQSSIVDVSALDGGRFLVGNQGFYSFSNVTPERAVATICNDFGISIGNLASTGISISRKFSGITLDKIIFTLYTLAGEQNGKRYLPRITGDSVLEVIEKKDTASLIIQQTMSVVNTWDIENLCNRVAIYSDTGGLLNVVEDTASQALHGQLQRVLTQRQGQDSYAEAQSILEDYGRQQTLTVELLNPPLELVTGAAVVLQDTGSGVSGLFWVDSDTHTWKNKNHYGKFKLNFRNMMNETSGGSEV